MFTSSSKKKKNITTVAFYNVENLLDTVDDPHTFDDDFPSEGKNNGIRNATEIKLKN